MEQIIAVEVVVGGSRAAVRRAAGALRDSERRVATFERLVPMPEHIRSAGQIKGGRFSAPEQLDWAREHWGAESDMLDYQLRSDSSHGLIINYCVVGDIPIKIMRELARRFPGVSLHGTGSVGANEIVIGSFASSQGVGRLNVDLMPKPASIFCAGRPPRPDDRGAVAFA